MYIRKILFAVLFLIVGTVSAGVKIENWITADGAKVYFVENHNLPMIDISVSFKAGSARDSLKNSGTASFTNHLMLLGSGGIDEVSLANQFTDIGAQLDSSFDRDKSSFSLRTLSEKKDIAIKLFNQVLHKPDFNENVITREKKRYYASIRQGETEPSSIASKAFMKAIYGNHPYAFPESGTVSTLESIKRSDLKSFYSNYYLSNHLSIVIVGDVDLNAAKEIAEKISLGLPNNPKASFYPEVQITEPQEIKISHPSTQAHLYYGGPVVKRGDPDFFPLYVGNYILGGGGFVSRLTGEVREKKGLVYSVYSYFMPMLELGPFQVGLQTKKDQIDEALALVKKPVKDFIQNGPTEKELQAAKSNMIGGFPLRLDSNKKIIEYISMMAFYNYPLDYLDTFADQVNAVTVQKIKAAFQKRVDMNKFSTVIVGIE